MSELIRRFTSRKFLLVLAAGIAAVANGEWTTVLGIVAAYLGVEGALDYKGQAEEVDPIVVEAISSAVFERPSDDEWDYPDPEPAVAQARRAVGFSV